LKFLNVGAGGPFAPTASTDTPSTSNGALTVPDSRLDEVDSLNVAFALASEEQRLVLKPYVSVSATDGPSIESTVAPRVNNALYTDLTYASVAPADLGDGTSIELDDVNEELLALLTSVR
jgi:hypothetical protein